MAVTDTTPPKSDVRKAMERAGGAVAGNMRRFMPNATVQVGKEEPLVLDQTVSERRKLGRVEVKVAVLSYIDSIFRQRTRMDGTVLGVSRERLVEELTDLVLELEDTCEIGSEPKNREPGSE